jgi:hypothetical protein
MEHQVLFTRNEEQAYGLASDLILAKIPCHVKIIRTYEGGVHDATPVTSETYAVIIRNKQDFNRAVEIRNTR